MITRRLRPVAQRNSWRAILRMPPLTPLRNAAETAPCVMETSKLCHRLCFRILAAISKPPSLMPHTPVLRSGPEWLGSCSARKILLWRLAIHRRPFDVTLRYRMALWICADTLLQ